MYVLLLPFFLRELIIRLPAFDDIRLRNPEVLIFLRRVPRSVLCVINFYRENYHLIGIVLCKIKITN